MSWTNPPKATREEEVIERCDAIDDLTNAAGQFMVVEARNRGMKDVQAVCTAAINLAVKMTAALAALSDNKEAHRKLANNLAQTFHDGIMDAIKNIEENDKLQAIKTEMFTEGKITMPIPKAGDDPSKNALADELRDALAQMEVENATKN